MIKTGRYGTVKFDPAAGSPLSLQDLISINAWKLSLKTDYEDVTCFGDTNKVYVPGLRDISGSIGGFWNSDSVILFDATEATTPGWLDLSPNSTEAAFHWSGLAYLDADIDCSAKGAPKISGGIHAAGPWSLAA
jgi:hypothetical protein